MASSRKTYDTDVITLRTVFAKNLLNSNIPAMRVLTADGAGGTYWAIPSTLGLNPAFNEIITSAGTYTADLSYNRFRLIAGEGIGMINGSPGSNQTTLFSKAFTQVDVSGGNDLNSYTSNNGVSPVIRIATTGAIQARADPATNTLFIDGPTTAPYIVSTGIYGFSQMQVIPSFSTATSSIITVPGDYITAASPSTQFRLVGLNDLQLSTNVTTNSVFFSISSFTSQTFLQTSTIANLAYPSTLSTVSTLFTPISLFNTTLVAISTQGQINFSSVVSTVNGIAISTGTQFDILTGLINARATIIQLNTEIGVVNQNIVSTVGGLGSSGYLSTTNGIPYFTTLSTNSLVLSTSASNYSLTASTNTITEQPYLWMNNRIYGTYSPIDVVVSSLGNTNSLLSVQDVGKYFLFTQNNAGTSVSLPSASQSIRGWNVLVKNMAGSSQNFTVNTTTPATLTPGSKTTVVCDGASFYSV